MLSTFIKNDYRRNLSKTVQIICLHPIVLLECFEILAAMMSENNEELGKMCILPCTAR